MPQNNLNQKAKRALAALAVCCLLAAPAAWADKHLPGEGVTVRPVEPPNLTAKFQHRILYRALERLGYEVAEPEEVEIQTMHVAVGAGDGDFAAAHWNLLHKAFYEESGGGKTMRKVGSLVAGTLQGYLVDKASHDAGMTNLGMLSEAKWAKRFDANGDGRADLAGCVPGWGCERVIEHHLDEYGLRDSVNHNQGAYEIIMADAISRLRQGKAILYYTWTPFWVSGVLVPGRDVEWLEVPRTSLPDGVEGETVFQGKNLGFALDSVRVIAGTRFLADNPAAEKLFAVATIDINDISAQNNKIRDGEEKDEDIARHADDWIAANQAEFDSWVQAAMDAAK